MGSMFFSKFNKKASCIITVFHFSERGRTSKELTASVPKAISLRGQQLDRELEPTHAEQREEGVPVQWKEPAREEDCRVKESRQHVFHERGATKSE